MKINGKTYYLWRAVDHEGEVLGILCHQTSRPQGCTSFSKESDEAVWSAKGHRHRSSSIISGCDGSIGKGKAPGDRSMAKRPREKFSPAFSTKRVFNATLSPREKTLQEFVSVYSAVCNHINHERHLISRDEFNGRREAALVEWQQVSAA